MLGRILSGSRYLVLVAVLGTFVAAIALLVYGGIQTFWIITKTISEGVVSSKGAKILALSAIEVVDLFLLGTVFYIIALGLYELFIDSEIIVPTWLKIRSLDDLKSKLVGVVVVILAVLFLGQVVIWDQTVNLLPFGSGIALVIAALTYFLSQKSEKS